MKLVRGIYYLLLCAGHDHASTAFLLHFAARLIGTTVTTAPSAAKLVGRRRHLPVAPFSRRRNSASSASFTSFCCCRSRSVATILAAEASPMKDQPWPLKGPQVVTSSLKRPSSRFLSSSYYLHLNTCLVCRPSVSALAQGAPRSWTLGRRR